MNRIPSLFLVPLRASAWVVPLTHGTDILDDLGELPFARQPSLPFAENNAVPELPPEEATVFAALGDQESGIDRLIDATGLPSQVVTATLMKLEMRRLVRALPGFRYVKR